MTKILKFSKAWRKLDDNVFTTLRKTTTIEEGDIVDVHTPHLSPFKAEALFVTTIDLKDISGALLCYDTDTKNRFQALRAIQSFYRTDILECNFNLLLLRRLIRKH